MSLNGGLEAVVLLLEGSSAARVGLAAVAVVVKSRFITDVSSVDLTRLCCRRLVGLDEVEEGEELGLLGGDVVEVSNPVIGLRDTMM